MKKRSFSVLIWLLLLGAYRPAERTIFSPDQNLSLTLTVSQKGDQPLSYQLHYGRQIILAPSALGFELEGGENWPSGFRVLSAKVREHRSTWRPVYGERQNVPDHYRELTVTLGRRSNRTAQMVLTFRLYNEGLAYRYRLIGSGESSRQTIKREYSAFSFPADLPAWASSWAQSEIRRQRLSDLSEAKERPLVVEMHDSLFVALGEAGLVDFARMKLKTDSLHAHTLTADLEGTATVDMPYTSPWRYVMVGRSPGELLEHNYFLLNLNEPNAIEDTSWIRPGKVIREVTLTTQGGLACVDFAAANGLQYVEFDAGWYGAESADTSDARTVTVDLKRSPGPLDLQRVLAYAQSRDIGILLYVNRRALERQLDEILPLYQSWGVKGVKYGFVQVGSQQWTDWLHRAIRKAAEHHLMVDIHDEYRPTGYSRTYPNLMTQEGIRGDEESPSTAHTLTTLFTRMIAGAGDNTICYYAPRVTEKMGGHAAQLAKAVLLYSPWQFLYWYDRPEGSPHQKGGAGASTGIIGRDPELAFFREIPTVWDDTKVLEGAIGRFATIARKSGDRWFVGALSAEERTVEIPLDFLEAGRDYEATLYLDNPHATGTTAVEVRQQPVSPKERLSLPLRQGRGLVMIIRPKS